MHMSALFVFPVLIFFGLITLLSAVKILRQYERAVVFTLGKFQSVKGPGLVLLIPFVQEMVRVDLRIQVVEIPTQDVISRDNVSMKVDAVLYFQRRRIRSGPSSRSRTTCPPPTCWRRPPCAPSWDSTNSTKCCPSARS